MGLDFESLVGIVIVSQEIWSRLVLRIIYLTISTTSTKPYRKELHNNALERGYYKLPDYNLKNNVSKENTFDILNKL